MRLAHARGLLRYRSPRGRFFLLFDVSGGVAEDGRVRVTSEASPEGLAVTIRALEDITVEALELRAAHPFSSGERFFLNGYQSWTDSREFHRDETIHPFPRLLRPALERFFRTNHYGDYDVVRASGKHLRGFSYLYFRGEDGDAIDFTGSLSEREGFTIFHVLPDERRVIITKDCEGKELRRGDAWPAFRLYSATGDEERVFSAWMDRFFQENRLHPRPAAPSAGWTSWYYHYTAISERITMENLDAFAKRDIPIDVFQIDDGWQAAVGDWLYVNHKFPRGLAWLTDRIHERGYRAGLWLAPFVAEKKSRLVAEHPEWLLRDEHGKPVPAGNNALWSGDFFGLDIGHRGFTDHLKRVFDEILGAWGFDLVKLDFLYGACLVPKRGKTRGEIMTDAMELCRDLVGEKLILGCGVPLAPAFGRVDYCRIGPDVGHEWKNTLTRGLGMRETISTVTALENAIGRRHLGGRAFQNDPDVFFLRRLSFEHDKPDPFIAIQEVRWGKRVPLTKDEKYSLFLLNNLFGQLVFTSDDISEYAADEMALYRSSFPLRDKENVKVSLAGVPPAFGEVGGFYKITFRIGALHYLVLANLSDEPARVTLEKDGFSRDERGGGRFHRRGEPVELGPHASFCLLEEGNAEIRLVGSESSLFPGSDIVEIAPDGEDGLTMKRHARAICTGLVYLAIPKEKSGIRVNGAFVPSKRACGRDNLVVLSADALPRAPRSTMD